MDYIIEFIFEIILEGMTEGASSKRVPLVIRILLVWIFFVLYGGIVALIFWAAICNRSILLGLIGIGVLLLFVAAAVKKIREITAPKDR